VGFEYGLASPRCADDVGANGSREGRGKLGALQRVAAVVGLVLEVARMSDDDYDRELEPYIVGLRLGLAVGRKLERAAVLDEIEQTVLEYQDKGLLGALLVRIAIMRRCIVGAAAPERGPDHPEPPE
jgi:hypothetical protein